MEDRIEQLALIALAIREVLDTATEPLTSKEIAATQAVSSLNPRPDDVTQMFYRWTRMTAAKRGFPLKRVRLTRDGAMYVYYNPRVVHVEPEKKPVVKKLAEKVNVVNPEPAQPTFDFNPIEFAPESVVTAPAAEVVQLPHGGKTVTLSVAGIQIKIELTA